MERDVRRVSNPSESGQVGNLSYMGSMQRSWLLPILLALLASGGFARGQEPAAEAGWEAAAKKAQQATVTVRIWTNVRSEADDEIPRDRRPIVGTTMVPPPPERESLPAVTVCSGV